MKPGIVVTARSTSSRLPGKALMPFRGHKTLVDAVIDRCEASGLSVCLAVPHNDERLKDATRRYDRNLYAGDEFHVLMRVYEAAATSHFDPVVRVTGDCPLAEPAIISAVLANWFAEAKSKEDRTFATNVWPRRTFAKGLDVEVVSLNLLQRLLEANDLKDDEREHVTLGLYRRAAEWIINWAPVENDGTWPTEYEPQLCVDTQEDYDRLNAIPQEVTA